MDYHPPPSNAPARLFRIWTMVWIVVGSAHLTLAIWTTAGSHLPGDLGDGRFNNLVLEHGFVAWTSDAYDWTSPGHFYPTADTLGWSDTHAGTLPVYILMRFAGLSPERAMQGWFVIVAWLNLWSAHRLFLLLGVARLWGPPLAVAAFAGVPWVWMTGTHAQLMPVFPGIWCAMFLTYWARRRQTSYGWLSLGAGLAQFAAGPYLAFFLGSILSTVLGIGIVLQRGVTSEESKPVPPRPSLLTHLMVAIGAALGMINLWIYANAVQSGAGRPMQEVINLTPEWSAWFSASPAHRWWPAGWPGGSLEHSEQVLFGGFLPWLLGLGAILAGWRHRCSSLRNRLAINLGATALLIVLTTVKWPGGFSIWIWLCEHLEPLRAFRAVGRIHIFVHSLLLLAFGLALSTNLKSRRWKVFAACSVTAVLVESWAQFQPSYAIGEAQQRREALVEAWESSGDRPVLAFAPGHSNQPDPHIQLDAWSAALAKRRHTLNGYSGAAPLEYMQFVWNPRRDQAEALARQLAIPSSQLSIVERYGEATASRLGFTYQEERSLRFLHGFALQPAEWSLFTPIEEFRFDGEFHYQFTPPAWVRFRLPDAAQTLRFVTAMRAGAYRGDNNSDGYDLRVIIRDQEGTVLFEMGEVINPRDDERARGFLPREMALPPGTDRVVEFRFGPGPSGLSPWDWPLLSQLHWE